MFFDVLSVAGHVKAVLIGQNFRFPDGSRRGSVPQVLSQSEARRVCTKCVPAHCCVQRFDWRVLSPRQKMPMSQTEVSDLEARLAGVSTSPVVELYEINERILSF